MKFVKEHYRVGELYMEFIKEIDAKRTTVINVTGVRILDGKVRQQPGFLKQCLTGRIQVITKFRVHYPIRHNTTVQIRGHVA